MEIEKCGNPFRRTKCGRTDIVVYIMYKSRKVPICDKCWTRIAKSDAEWGSE